MPGAPVYASVYHFPSWRGSASPSAGSTLPICENLRAFVDTGFIAHHDILEYWDGAMLKIFHGIVTMKPDDSSKPIVKPVMSQCAEQVFYSDPERDTERNLDFHWYCMTNAATWPRSDLDGYQLLVKVSTPYRCPYWPPRR
jgi:hypothetical protein